MGSSLIGQNVTG